MNSFYREVGLGWAGCLGLVNRPVTGTLIAGLLAGAAFSSSASAQSINLSTIGAGSGPGFVINGQGSNDDAGYSVSAAGDVNGDGLGDVIVGARRSDPPGGIIAGRSYVVFGQTGNGAIDLSTVANGTSGLGFAIVGEATGHQSGSSVSGAGDVNGDGRADLIVGAPNADPAGKSNAGRAYVIFGKTSSSTVELSVIAASTTSFGFVINGEDADDSMGASVAAAGDVNGDGRGDVIVGARFNNVLGSVQAGSAYVVFGKVDNDAVELSAVASGSSGLGFAILGQAPYDHAGHAVASAGDVNGDGLADVIVGAPWRDNAAVANVGRAYVVFGKTTSTAVSLLSVANAVAGTGFAINGFSAGDELGTSVAGVGDMNGDGLGDVVVGVPFADGVVGPDAGRAVVVFGKPSASMVQLSALGANGFIIEAAAGLDALGTSVSAAGDVNLDGLGDVIVGAPQSAGVPGHSYVVLGKTGSATIELTALIGGTNAPGFVINGEAAGDYSGRSVNAAGDVNGDGLADIIVGAPDADTTPGNNAGRAYVIFSPIPGYPSVAPNLGAGYTTYVAAGNAPRAGVGSNRFGRDLTTFVDSQCWVDFAGGAIQSNLFVFRTNSDAGVSGLPGNPPATDIANAYWRLTTTRLDYGFARVTLKYRDSAITGMTEADLRIYAGPSLNGPWTPLANPTIDTARNQVAGDTDALNNMDTYLVISDIPPLFTNGDANADGLVNVADYTEVRNLLAGHIDPPVSGDGDVNNDGVISQGDSVAIREHIVNGAPLAP